MLGIDLENLFVILKNAAYRIKEASRYFRAVSSGL